MDGQVCFDTVLLVSYFTSKVIIIMLWIVFLSDIIVHDLQIVTAVSVIQKLPEIARSTITSPEVMAFYEHLTSKSYNAR